VREIALKVLKAQRDVLYEINGDFALTFFTLNGNSL